MSLEGQVRPEKRQVLTPALVEVSVALVVALLLVVTGLRLAGGFDVPARRGAQAATAGDAETPILPVARASRPLH